MPDGSIDLVVAAQSLHWFEPADARSEFDRILRPGGRATAIWNERRRSGTSFQIAFESLLVEMQQDIVGDHRRYSETVDDIADRFFGLGSYSKAVFAYSDRLELHQFTGRIFSSSFAPAPGHPRYSYWSAGTKDLFEAYADAGYVEIEYDTVVISGNPS